MANPEQVPNHGPSDRLSSQLNPLAGLSGTKLSDAHLKFAAVIDRHRKGNIPNSDQMVAELRAIPSVGSQMLEVIAEHIQFPTLLKSERNFQRDVCSKIQCELCIAEGVLQSLSAALESQPKPEAWKVVAVPLLNFLKRLGALVNEEKVPEEIESKAIQLSCHGYRLFESSFLVGTTHNSDTLADAFREPEFLKQVSPEALKAVVCETGSALIDLPWFFMHCLEFPTAKMQNLFPIVGEDAQAMLRDELESWLDYVDSGDIDPDVFIGQFDSIAVEASSKALERLVSLSQSDEFDLAKKEERFAKIASEKLFRHFDRVVEIIESDESLDMRQVSRVALALYYIPFPGDGGKFTENRAIGDYYFSPSQAHKLENLLVAELERAKEAKVISAISTIVSALGSVAYSLDTIELLYAVVIGGDRSLAKDAGNAIKEIVARRCKIGADADWDLAGE